MKLIEEMKFCRGVLKREIKYSKCENVYLDKSGKIGAKHQHKVVKYNHTGVGGDVATLGEGEASLGMGIWEEEDLGMGVCGILKVLASWLELLGDKFFDVFWAGGYVEA